MQVHHVIVHTPEQVREIIAEAGRIADDSGVEDERWQAVFEQATSLLGARHTLALTSQPPPMAFDLPNLKNGRRG